MRLGCLDHGETSVGVAGIGESMGVDSGVSSGNVKAVEAVETIAVDTGISGVRDCCRKDGGGSSHKGSGGRDLMHRGGGLLRGQTSGNGVIKSGDESGLGGSNVLGVGNISGGDLGGLAVGVDGRQGGVLPSLSGGEGGVKDGPGLLDLSGVLDGEGGGNSQDRGDQLKGETGQDTQSLMRVITSYQFVHFVCGVQRIFRVTEETAGRARVYIASPVTTPGIAWQGAGEGPDWFVMTSDQAGGGGWRHGETTGRNAPGSGGDQRRRVAESLCLKEKNIFMICRHQPHHREM